MLLYFCNWANTFIPFWSGIKKIPSINFWILAVLSLIGLTLYFVFIKENFIEALLELLESVFDLLKKITEICLSFFVADVYLKKWWEKKSEKKTNVKRDTKKNYFNISLIGFFILAYFFFSISGLSLSDLKAGNETTPSKNPDLTNTKPDIDVKQFVLPDAKRESGKS